MKKLLLCSFLAFCSLLFLKTNTLYADSIDGWKTEDQHKVYYVNGEKYTKGWKKIGDYKYYFEKNTGYMAVNKIVGSKEKGYYYVGEDGVRCKDAIIQKAVDLVMKKTKKQDSQKKRLKKCFDYICKGRYAALPVYLPKASELPEFANFVFKNKRGNCYRYASAIAYIGKVLGYETRVVPGYQEIKRRPHGWCEVKSDGKYLVCDGSYAIHSKNPSFTYRNYKYFMIKKKDHPRDLKVNVIYQLTVNKGKVKWKKSL